jgi:hypothetical protein
VVHPANHLRGSVGTPNTDGLQLSDGVGMRVKNKMSSTKNMALQPQRGMGLTSVLVIISAVIFIGLFAFKVAPHYMENWTVSKIAEDVATNPDLLKKPRSKVYAYIGQAYRTNNLWDLDPEETIKLKKDGKRGYIVTVKYERRDKLFHNIDLVTSFDTSTDAAQ